MENKADNETKNTDIINIDNKSLSDQTDDILSNAERRISQIDKIIDLSIKRTNENDWIDQSGKPYLLSSGAEKIARLFGISWKIIKNEKIISEDEKSKFYFYQCVGIFSFSNKNDMIDAIGTCSSKDVFFAKVNGEFKPLSEIDETNIMKSAYSNCIVNGITRLLGIRNLTWAQVKIDRSKVATVTYANGGAGGGKISEPQRKRLYAIAHSKNVNIEIIKKHLKENYNLDSSNDINRKDYEDICNWVESQ